MLSTGEPCATPAGAVRFTFNGDDTAGNFVCDGCVFALAGFAGDVSFDGEFGLRTGPFLLTAFVVLGLAERRAAGSDCGSADALSSVERGTRRPPTGSKFSVEPAVHVVAGRGRWRFDGELEGDWVSACSSISTCFSSRCSSRRAFCFADADSASCCSRTAGSSALPPRPGLCMPLFVDVATEAIEPVSASLTAHQQASRELWLDEKISAGSGCGRLWYLVPAVATCS